MSDSVKSIQKAQQKRDLQKLTFNPELENIIKDASINFKGNGTTLETAIGALFIGQIFGWRVLRLMHGSNAYVKYEKILGVQFKNVCPDKGPLTQRSVGWRLTEKLGGFWKVVTGKVQGRTPEIDEGY